MDELDGEDLGAIFNTAASFLAQQVARNSKSVNDDAKLQVYGLYKQATLGKCDAPKPGIFDITGRRKWQAWSDCGDMPSKDAMQEYIILVSSLFPDWMDSTDAAAGSKPGSTGTFGPAVSTLATEPHEEPNSSSLVEVAGQGDTQAVKRLLDAGCDVNSRDECGCSALHFAADRGQLGVARLLVGRGAELDAQDEDGQTPLHYARLCGNEEVYQFLVEAGADVSLVDSAGQTAEQVA